MKEKEGSRMTPKTLFYCYLFLSLLGLNYTYSEQELSPTYCGKKIRLQFSLPSVFVLPEILSPWRLISIISKVYCSIRIPNYLHNTPGKTNSLSPIFLIVQKSTPKKKKRNIFFSEDCWT